MRCTHTNTYIFYIDYRECDGGIPQGGVAFVTFI